MASETLEQLLIRLRGKSRDEIRRALGELANRNVVVPVVRFQNLNDPKGTRRIQVVHRMEKDRRLVHVFSSEDLLLSWAGDEVYQCFNVAAGDLAITLPPDSWLIFDLGTDRALTLSPEDVQVLAWGEGAKTTPLPQSTPQPKPSTHTNVDEDTEATTIAKVPEDVIQDRSGDRPSVSGPESRRDRDNQGEKGRDGSRTDNRQQNRERNSTDGNQRNEGRRDGRNDGRSQDNQKQQSSKKDGSRRGSNRQVEQKQRDQKQGDQRRPDQRHDDQRQGEQRQGEQRQGEQRQSDQRRDGNQRRDEQHRERDGLRSEDRQRSQRDNRGDRNSRNEQENEQRNDPSSIPESKAAVEAVQVQPTAVSPRKENVRSRADTELIQQFSPSEHGTLSSSVQEEVATALEDHADVEDEGLSTLLNPHHIPRVPGDVSAPIRSVDLDAVEGTLRLELTKISQRYSMIDEGYLVRSPGHPPTFQVGILANDLRPEARFALIEEIALLSKRLLGEAGALEVYDDLSKTTSRSWEMFQTYAPYFVRDRQKTSDTGFADSSWDRDRPSKSRPVTARQVSDLRNSLEVERSGYGQDQYRGGDPSVPASDDLPVVDDPLDDAESASLDSSEAESSPQVGGVKRMFLGLKKGRADNRNPNKRS